MKGGASAASAFHRSTDTAVCLWIAGSICLCCRNDFLPHGKQSGPVIACPQIDIVSCCSCISRVHHMRGCSVHQCGPLLREINTVQRIWVSRATDVLHRIACFLHIIGHPAHQCGFSTAGAPFDGVKGLHLRLIHPLVI